MTRYAQIGVKVDTLDDDEGMDGSVREITINGEIVPVYTVKWEAGRGGAAKVILELPARLRIEGYVHAETGKVLGGKEEEE